MTIDEKKEFRIEDCMIMEYYGTGGEVVIPDGVTDIFFEAFYGNFSITSVNIPGTILDITPFVFEHCESLEELTLNEGVTIVGVNAFSSCKKLEIINLPKSINCINSGAFSNCPSLKEIRYNGSIEDWEIVIKKEDWDENTGDYNIIFDCRK